MNEFQSQGRPLCEPVHFRYSMWTSQPIKDPGHPPYTEVEPDVIKPNKPIEFVMMDVKLDGHDGGPKCECGKDKYNFAFHMRFCPKWEPIA